MSDKINPEIFKFQYGKRELKDIEVYPLSIGDQMKMTSLISDFLEKLSSAQELAEGKDADIFRLMVEVVVENLKKVVVLICCVEESEAEKVVDSMTNKQMLELVTHIWETNYEDLVKNGRNLFEKIAPKSQVSKRSFPQSVKNMVTKSKKSSKKATKKGA